MYIYSFITIVLMNLINIIYFYINIYIYTYYLTITNDMIIISN